MSVGPQAGLVRCVLPLFVFLGVLPAHSVESLQGQVAAIAGDGWAIAGLEVAVHLGNSGLRGEIRVDSLELPAADLSFANTSIDCGRIEISAAEFGCTAATFDVDLPGVGRERFPGSVIYDRETGATRFDLREVPVARTRIHVHGTATDSNLGVEIEGNDLQLGDLTEIAGHFVEEPLDLAASGTANVRASLRIGNGDIENVSLQGALTDASMSNEAGTLVTDGMRGVIDLTASQAAGAWQFTMEMTAGAGEAYVEPVYANLGENALSFAAEGRATAALDNLELTTFTFTQGSLIDAAGTLLIAVPRGQEEALGVSGSLQLKESSVEAIYTSLLQVLLAGTVAGDLETAGTVAGTITFDNNVATGADLSLKDLSADDSKERFAVYGLNGRLHWPGPEGEADESPPSHLSWESASAYSIPFGAAEVEVRLGGDDVELLNTLRIPTMGGALVVNRFLMNNYGKEDATGLLDAKLEPIQLGELTGAFGWPAFSGSLSGQLPLLQYDGEAMTVGGTLSAEAFDGDIEFHNLRLEQPFGLAPRLYGELRLRRLDLEQVTDTFSFGLIQGRLSGDVTGLEMVAWRPVAMDLHLYTPEDRTARRRISQRAVENLASVGGSGAAAALSSGFMKFFEDFSYDRIGIRCVLKDGTCAMSGAGPARASDFGQGYYIVKGSGLPRIDVVGYRHQVSWTGLVRQLVTIMESGTPVVN